MSLIKDIRDDMRQLDTSQKALRKFALILNLIVLIYSAYLLYRAGFQYRALPLWIVMLEEILLPTILFPMVLHPLYRLWMFAAFVFGWFISRLLIIGIYFAVITPIAVLARVFNKDFLDKKFRDGKTSYWKDKEHLKSSSDYEKLY